MVTLTETSHAGAHVVSEANGYRSREQITIAENQDLAAGQVLGKVTASSRYVVLAPGASDGSQTAAAILFAAAKTGAGETKPATAHVRDCEVRDVDLTWPGGISGPQKTTAIGQLAGLGVILR